VKALVLGGSGFVGQALCRRLLASGHAVRVLVRPGSKPAAALPDALDARQGELGDPESMAAAAEGCQVMFHCAGESARQASSEALSWIHVAGTENAMNAARHAGVRRAVLLSCADATLCNRDRLGWREDAVLGQAPLGQWARSKLLGEELALQASDQRLSVCALRPGYVWGPGERTLLPELCREARAGGVRLFGGGDNLVATLYIDNLIDALLAAAEAPDAGGQVFHVNDGDNVTAREFFDLLCTALGLPRARRGVYAVSYAAAWLRRARGGGWPWPEDIAQRGRGCLLDCLRAATTLDYRPRVGLDAGRQALARWAEAVGGPLAIERLARPAAGAADARRFAHLADELS
jgi:nucleoside-diphosphate-sugar epimerase